MPAGYHGSSLEMDSVQHSLYDKYQLDQDEYHIQKSEYNVEYIQYYEYE